MSDASKVSAANLAINTTSVKEISISNLEETANGIAFKLSNMPRGKVDIIVVPESIAKLEAFEIVNTDKYAQGRSTIDSAGTTLTRRVDVPDGYKVVIRSRKENDDVFDVKQISFAPTKEVAGPRPTEIGIEILDQTDALVQFQIKDIPVGQVDIVLVPNNVSKQNAFAENNKQDWATFASDGTPQTRKIENLPEGYKIVIRSRKADGKTFDIKQISFESEGNAAAMSVSAQAALGISAITPNVLPQEAEINSFRFDPVSMVLKYDIQTPHKLEWTVTRKGVNPKPKNYTLLPHENKSQNLRDFLSGNKVTSDQIQVWVMVDGVEHPVPAIVPQTITDTSEIINIDVKGSIGFVTIKHPRETTSLLGGVSALANHSSSARVPEGTVYSVALNSTAPAMDPSIVLFNQNGEISAEYTIPKAMLVSQGTTPDKIDPKLPDAEYVAKMIGGEKAVVKSYTAVKYLAALLDYVSKNKPTGIVKAELKLLEKLKTALEKQNNQIPMDLSAIKKMIKALPDSQNKDELLESLKTLDTITERLKQIDIAIKPDPQTSILMGSALINGVWTTLTSPLNFFDNKNPAKLSERYSSGVMSFMNATAWVPDDAANWALSTLVSFYSSEADKVRAKQMLINLSDTYVTDNAGLNALLPPDGKPIVQENAIKVATILQGSISLKIKDASVKIKFDADATREDLLKMEVVWNRINTSLPVSNKLITRIVFQLEENVSPWIPQIYAVALAADSHQFSSSSGRSINVGQIREMLQAVQLKGLTSMEYEKGDDLAALKAKEMMWILMSTYEQSLSTSTPQKGGSEADMHYRLFTHFIKGVVYDDNANVAGGFKRVFLGKQGESLVEKRGEKYTSEEISVEQIEAGLANIKTGARIQGTDAFALNPKHKMWQGILRHEKYFPNEIWMGIEVKTSESDKILKAFIQSGFTVKQHLLAGEENTGFFYVKPSEWKAFISSNGGASVVAIQEKARQSLAVTEKEQPLAADPWSLGFFPLVHTPPNTAATQLTFRDDMIKALDGETVFDAASRTEYKGVVGKLLVSDKDRVIKWVSEILEDTSYNYKTMIPQSIQQQRDIAKILNLSVDEAEIVDKTMKSTIAKMMKTLGPDAQNMTPDDFYKKVLFETKESLRKSLPPIIWGRMMCVHEKYADMVDVIIVKNQLDIIRNMFNFEDLKGSSLGAIGNKLLSGFVSTAHAAGLEGFAANETPKKPEDESLGVVDQSYKFLRNMVNFEEIYKNAWSSYAFSKIKPLWFMDIGDTIGTVNDKIDEGDYVGASEELATGYLEYITLMLLMGNTGGISDEMIKLADAGTKLAQHANKIAATKNSFARSKITFMTELAAGIQTYFTRGDLSRLNSILSQPGCEESLRGLQVSIGQRLESRPWLKTLIDPLTMIKHEMMKSQNGVVRLTGETFNGVLEFVTKPIDVIPQLMTRPMLRAQTTAHRWAGKGVKSLVGGGAAPTAPNARVNYTLTQGGRLPVSSADFPLIHEQWVQSLTEIAKNQIVDPHTRSTVLSALGGDEFKNYLKYKVGLGSGDRNVTFQTLFSLVPGMPQSVISGMEHETTKLSFQLTNESERMYRNMKDSAVNGMRERVHLKDVINPELGYAEQITKERLIEGLSEKVYYEHGQPLRDLQDRMMSDVLTEMGVAPHNITQNDKARALAIVTDMTGEWVGQVSGAKTKVGTLVASGLNKITGVGDILKGYRTQYRQIYDELNKHLSNCIEQAHLAMNPTSGTGYHDLRSGFAIAFDLQKRIEMLIPYESIANAGIPDALRPVLEMKAFSPEVMQAIHDDLLSLSPEQRRSLKPAELDLMVQRHLSKYQESLTKIERRIYDIEQRCGVPHDQLQNHVFDQIDRHNLGSQDADAILKSVERFSQSKGVFNDKWISELTIRLDVATTGLRGQTRPHRQTISEVGGIGAKSVRLSNAAFQKISTAGSGAILGVAIDVARNLIFKPTSQEKVPLTDGLKLFIKESKSKYRYDRGLLYVTGVMTAAEKEKLISAAVKQTNSINKLFDDSVKADHQWKELLLPSALTGAAAEMVLTTKWIDANTQILQIKMGGKYIFQGTVIGAITGGVLALYTERELLSSDEVSDLEKSVIVFKAEISGAGEAAKMAVVGKVAGDTLEAIAPSAGKVAATLKGAANLGTGIGVGLAWTKFKEEFIELTGLPPGAKVALDAGPALFFAYLKKNPAVAIKFIEFLKNSSRLSKLATAVTALSGAGLPAAALKFLAVDATVEAGIWVLEKYLDVERENRAASNRI